MGGVTAQSAVDLAGINCYSATSHFHKLFELIAQRLFGESSWINCEIEVDESLFGGHIKGKHGLGADGKVPVFGLLERGEKADEIIL